LLPYKDDPLSRTTSSFTFIPEILPALETLSLYICLFRQHKK